MNGIGGVCAKPIINQPEVAILALHKITKKAVVIHNQMAIRDMTYLLVNFDYWVLDGTMAAEFMSVMKQYLEDQVAP